MNIIVLKKRFNHFAGKMMKKFTLSPAKKNNQHTS